MSCVADISELYELWLRHPSVATDSRSVPDGSLFFALRGDRFDGNRFAADAIRRGAMYAVVDDPDVVPAGEEGKKYVLTGDALRTLQELAAFHRTKLGIPVVAITGTNGKTTTKELTAAILSKKYKVHSTAGNLNNHIGVPLTLLSMRADAEVAVVEMGASGPGEIELLCGIAAPDYGLITNVGRAHLEGFGSEEGVRRAKGELYGYLSRHGGTAFVNGEDGTLREMAAGTEGLSVIFYDTVSVRGLKNNLTGAYNINNIGAAAAIGRRFGVPETDIAAAVAEYMPDSDRSRRINTGSNIVIADCYNANPSSMMAAISNFRTEDATIAVTGNIPMPKALILGDMLELGEWAGSEHESVLLAALDEGFAELYLIGDNFAAAYRRKMQGRPGNGRMPLVRIFSDAGGAEEYLRKNPLSGKFVLLKGSRRIALEKIIPVL